MCSWLVGDLAGACGRVLGVGVPWRMHTTPHHTTLLVCLFAPINVININKKNKVRNKFEPVGCEGNGVEHCAEAV